MVIFYKEGGEGRHEGRGQRTTGQKIEEQIRENAGRIEGIHHTSWYRRHG